MATSRQNAQSRARRKEGRRLAEVIRELGTSCAEISKITGIDRTTLENLDEFTPHLSTIARVSKYLEGVAKERRKKQRRARVSQRKKAIRQQVKKAKAKAKAHARRLSVPSFVPCGVATS
jgi:hypothetical protein